MDENEMTLIIEVKYNNNIQEIKENKIISYEELITRVIDFFNIDKNKKDYIEFTYLDEDKDINILDYEATDIIEASKEIGEGYFLLQLNMIIVEVKKDNVNLNKEENLNNIKENNQIEENDVKLNKEDIEKVKKDLKKGLQKYYKNKLEEMKNKINEIINEKYDLIEKEIDQISHFENKKDIIKINVKDIDKNTIIQNFQTKNADFTILENEDFSIIDKIKTSNIKTENEIEKKIFKIKEKIKSLIKIKNKTKSDYLKFFEETYETMKKGSFDINDINKYFKIYLKPKEKEKDRMNFINILNMLYKYIEMRKINEINLNFFQKDIGKEISLEDDKKDKDYKSLLDSLVDLNSYKKVLVENINNKVKIE